MRCVACNKVLSDFEATRRYASTRDFTDLCTKCFSTIAGQVEVEERHDLDETVLDIGLDWDDLDGIEDENSGH